MGKEYYYLATLLPSLVFGRKTPSPSGSFLELCREHLEPEKYDIIRKIIKSEPFEEPAHRFLDEWLSWDISLRTALARMRTKRLQASKEGIKQGQSSGDEEFLFSDLLKRIHNSQNPLSAEIILAKTKWDKIEDMEFCHYFDLEKIIAHALKLKIMERLDSFDQAKGMKKFEEISDSIEADNQPFQIENFDL